MNNEFIMESLQNEVHIQQSALEVQIIVKKTQQSGNLVVLALLNISMDAMQGNEQKHKTYWNRVLEFGTTSIKRGHIVRMYSLILQRKIKVIQDIDITKLCKITIINFFFLFYKNMIIGGSENVSV